MVHYTEGSDELDWNSLGVIMTRYLEDDVIRLSLSFIGMITDYVS